jgi:hypothetical protein
MIKNFLLNYYQGGIINLMMKQYLSAPHSQDTIIAFFFIKTKLMEHMESVVSELVGKKGEIGSFHLLENLMTTTKKTLNQ